MRQEIRTMRKMRFDQEDLVNLNSGLTFGVHYATTPIGT